jgi:hypothetical protein
MESPRLLPFPYHNDCHFLPTAERAQKRKAPVGSFSNLSLYSHRTTTTTTTYTPRRAASAPPIYRPSCNSLSSSSSSASTSTTTSSLEKLESFFLKLLDLFKRKRKHEQLAPTRRPKEDLVWFAEFTVNPPPPNGMVMAAA